MISVEQLTVEFGGSPLFDEISFLVNPKDKIALVGKNGAGKTTLLRIFSGKQHVYRCSKYQVKIDADLLLQESS